MAKIPKSVLQTEFIESMNVIGFKLINRGKVRDIFNIPFHPHLMLIMASQRISIFDFVLPALVEYKGEVLTALTFFWLTQVLENFPSHFEYSERYPTFNAVHDCEPVIRASFRNTLVVRKVNIQPYELIFRRHLGGSVFKKYQETGKVAGIDYPPGLPKWSYLEKPAFTPSTKSVDGHDKNIDVREFIESAGDEGILTAMMISKAYNVAYDFASQRGILILDSKFEAGNRILADEIITPDSSRFTTKESFDKAMAESKDPAFHDKEPVRDWGRKVETPFTKDSKNIVGLDKLDPENDEHVQFVHSLHVPKEVVDETTSRYLRIFRMITGYSLLQFQREFMAPRTY